MMKIKKWLYILPFILTLLGIYAFMTCCEGMKNHSVTCFVAYGTLTLALVMQWVTVFMINGLKCKHNELHAKTKWNGTERRKGGR